MTRHFQWHDIPIKWHGIPDTELFIFENFPRNHSTIQPKVEGFYIKKLSLEFLIFLRHNNFFFWKWTFFRHKPKLLVLRTLWMFVKFFIFVAENPRIPFYPFIFLYHENMEFRVFLWHFQWNFEKISNFIFSIHETTTTDQQCFHYFW